MIEELEKQPFIKTFQQAIEKEHSLTIENLFDSAKAALLYFAQQKSKRHILIITAHEGHTQLVNDLQYFNSKEPIVFPAWEALPGEDITPSLDIMGMRIHHLEELLKSKKPEILITSLQGAMQKVLSPESLEKLSETFSVKQEFPFSEMTPLLTSLGYQRVKLVSDKGEFAVRGGIIDLFPIQLPQPIRIEFFGDTIEEIRTYDPMSQKSTGKISSFSLSYADEKAKLKSDKMGTLFDYLSKDTLVVFDDLLALENRLVQLKAVTGFNSSMMMDEDSFFQKINSMPHLFFPKESLESLSDVQGGSFSIFSRNFTTKRIFAPFMTITDHFQMQMEELVHHFTTNAQIYFLSSSDQEENSLKEKIGNIKLPKETKFLRGYLSSGFVFQENFIVIPYTEWTKRVKLTRQKWRNTFHTPAAEFHELTPGDLVVHFHNGIGIFRGIEKQKNHLGLEAEFLVIEYAEKSKLFVPISQSHLISRYIGSHEEKPSLHQLGSSKWQKTKEGVQKAIIGYAKDLLTLQAEREIKGGFAYPVETEAFQQFSDAFPYQETDDQLTAISDILNDMGSSKAMDRLVCGDVGYGKTEVAMRAAFKAAVDGKKQVAVLVPTTVLAVQHFETFQERMQHFDVRIGIASRFQTPQKVKQTLEAVQKGEIDILIGTHRLISSDVIFKDLGLVIIDEEQRFGVRAKEKLKMIKTGVDCLTMTATPIPRTLYMSLIHLKEMSVINSPPHDRLPIKTIMAERDDEIIKNALLRELARDGQAYFIHNRVESIHEQAEKLQKLVPSARIAIAHGQMDPEIIDRVFHSFKRGDTDILVATSIVENGIDIPNANTIIIDRADRFGVADLYQLRGRVGRWNKTAYAYFLVPENRSLPEITQKRLQALVETSGFGGGVKLAMRDLEIRGAGDLLGTEQSGHVSTIGFHLYCKLLKKAIDGLKKQKPTSFLETRMEFAFDAKIPDTYIHEPSIRLELYHRLGDAEDVDEVSKLMDEIKDRFGPLPEPLIWLHHMTRIRIFAHLNQFTQLKFLKHSLIAEQKQKKDPLVKNLLIPPPQSAQELELITIKRLTENFSCPHKSF